MIRRWFRALVRTGSLVRPSPLSPAAGRRGRALLRLEAVEDRTLASVVPVEPPKPIPAPEQSQISSTDESVDAVAAADPGVPLPTDGWNTASPPSDDSESRPATVTSVFMTVSVAGVLDTPPTPSAARHSSSLSEKAAVAADEAAESTAQSHRAPGSSQSIGTGTSADVALDGARPARSEAVPARSDRPTAPAGRDPSGTAASSVTVRADAGQQVHRPVSGKIRPDRVTTDDSRPAAPRSGRAPQAAPAAASTQGPAAADLSDGALLHRFVAHRDQAAFTALVQRHGPLVLGVCQRVLGDFQAAQDASQATFVVLARKAGMLDRTSPLGGWLYKVAYHLALRSRAVAARQRLGEREAAFEETSSPALTDNTLDLEQQELHQVLHEELQGLPEKYRAPLALVYFDGRSHADAAQAIGLPRGSMAKRVGEGLDRLRERLIDRGLGL